MRVTYLDYESSSDEDADPPTSLFKVSLVGAHGVGKSSFVSRLKKRPFSLVTAPTLALEVHDRICLGDIRCTLWEIPPDACDRYYFRNLMTDAIVVLFNSDKEDTLHYGAALWKQLQDRLHPNCAPNVWFAYRGRHYVDHVPYVPPERLFHIDMMTNDGLLDFVYDIRCTLLRQHGNWWTRIDRNEGTS